jgi:hypothetical protein
VNYLHGSSLQLPHHPVLKYSCFGLVKMLHRYLRCLSGSLRSCSAVLNPFILRSGNTAAERFVFSTRIKHPASFSSPSAVHGLFCRCFLAAGRYLSFLFCLIKPLPEFENWHCTMSLCIQRIYRW